MLIVSYNHLTTIPQGLIGQGVLLLDRRSPQPRKDRSVLAYWVTRQDSAGSLPLVRSGAARTST